MPEKVYLTSDQYVVAKLQEKEIEIEKLNSKIDEVIEKCLIAQAQVKETKDFKKNFECNLSVDKTYFKIEFAPKHDGWGTTLLLSNSTDPNNLGADFKSLLDFLELKLPELPETNETKED